MTNFSHSSLAPKILYVGYNMCYPENIDGSKKEICDRWIRVYSNNVLLNAIYDLGGSCTEITKTKQ